MAKKENQKKNGHANDQWQERKRSGRPKQVWVWDEEPVTWDMEVVSKGKGHWEKEETQ